ncbi:type VI secretion system accessory protein TagJ [Roseiconus lacunae]|uniref:Type VI secretion system accessory protein TagJ n=1 Tax=Roseiconus lacunae TaxID=2605694 RepID=A0ABT7PE12_9BACT|nr:type VI secretion system accessory protein TagJ [Roseiconus lacunae]MDM4014729.1 type VI secretion system accessory protein TagJ [Roseiconus lacunae]WRQ50319.1 type VI secretion system accessory protein TagJ [Stieleria sp. HD01]
MLAEELLRENKLDEAFAELKQRVQKDPSEPKYRVFLFQMLSVLGKWESALSQLEICGQLADSNLAMVQAYREAIRCEVFRHRVFAGETSPLILGEPDRWLALLIEALKLSAAGKHEQAETMRIEAFEMAPMTSGTVQTAGEQSLPFEWMADADPRLGPVLEVLMNGQYYWVPFNRIAQIDLEPPQDLRDFVWMPAHFVLAGGGESFGMIPTRYPNSHLASDPTTRLARQTTWVPITDTEQEIFIGEGQRMLATDEDEFALLEIRKISLASDVEGSDQLFAVGDTGTVTE